MLLKRSMALTVALIALAVAATTAHEGEKHTAEESSEAPLPPEPEVVIDTRTIEGEIIDITCYLRHDSRGPEHLKCALYCAELGMPLGLLEDDTGDIYLILPSGHSDPRDAVLAFVSKKVTVTGIVWGSGGLNGIEIEDIRELTRTEPADAD